MKQLVLCLCRIKKILNVRFFDDDKGKRWSKNVVDKDYEILCVSQFTLCYSLKGNKLDFHHAMKADESEQFYGQFLEKLRTKYKPELIKDGKFGAYMQVDICNDGPVTIDITSEKDEKKQIDSGAVASDSGEQIHV